MNSLELEYFVKKTDAIFKISGKKQFEKSMQECIFERHSKLHKSARNLKRDAHEMFVDKTRIRAIQVRLHRAMHGEASPTI